MNPRHAKVTLSLCHVAPMEGEVRDIHKAAETGQLLTLRKFVEEQGVDANTLDKDGNTPLHWACLYGKNSETVKYLLSKGAVVDVPNREEGHTPLHWAAEAANLYNAGADINLFIFLLSVSSLSNSSPSPLLTLFSVSVLVDFVIHIHLADASGYTPLIHAAQYGRNPLIIRYLLQHGARIDAEDANGCTPLHWAAYQNLPHVITLLVAAGANINKADSGGLTPLHRASSRGNWHCVNTLLEHAADPLLKDSDGDTPESIALKKRNGQVASLLENSRRWSYPLRKDVRFLFGLPVLVVTLCFWLLVSQRFLVSLVALPLIAFGLHRAFGALFGDLTASSHFWLGLRAAVYGVSMWCYLFKMLPYLSQDIITQILFFVVNLALLYKSYSLFYGDPGYLAAQPNVVQDVLADAEKSAPVANICNTCLVKQPLRAQHCPVTNRCVARYDSYSTLIATAVGAQNHLSYLIVCCLSLAMHTLFVLLCIYTLRGVDRSGTNASIFSDAPLVILVLLAHATLLGLEIRNIYYQWKAISQGLTLYEFRNPASCTYLTVGGSFINPFDKRSPIENIRSFLNSTEDWRNTYYIDTTV